MLPLNIIDLQLDPRDEEVAPELIDFLDLGETPLPRLGLLLVASDS
jgi:hypothetical protein